MAVASASTPALVLHDSYAFPNCDELIGGYFLQMFAHSIRPNNVDDNGFRISDPEMEAGIIGRIIARLAHSSLCLHLVSIVDQHSGANGAAIRLHALELNFDPVLFSRKIVPQKGGRFVHVDDEDIDVAIVVEIAKSAAAAGMRFGYSGTRLSRKFLESSVSQVTEKDARRSIRIIRELAFHFGVNAAGHNEQIRRPIIVEVKHTRPPTDEASLDSDFGSAGLVIKVALTIVSIHAAGIAHEMRLEQIEVPV